MTTLIWGDGWCCFVKFWIQQEECFTSHFSCCQVTVTVWYHDCDNDGPDRACLLMKVKRVIHQVFIYIYVCVCVCVYRCVCLCVCVRAYVSATVVFCMYTYIEMCVCVCVCIYRERERESCHMFVVSERFQFKWFGIIAFGIM